MVVSSFAVTRKAMVVDLVHDQNRKLYNDSGDDQENNKNYDHNTNSEGNHHTIPRKDFGKYISNNNENGSG